MAAAAAALLLVVACGADVPEPLAGATPAGSVAGAAAEAAELPAPVVLDPPAATAAPPGPVTPTPRPAPAPSMRGVDSEAGTPTLEALRATERFLELATHERAVDAVWARFAWATFAPQADEQVLFEWSNKPALWDDLVPDFRDACLLAGPEASRPMWDAQILIAAGGGLAWNDTTTGGRGDFVEFSCVYDDAGEPVERFFGALITTDDDAAGRVRLRMPPFDVREADYPDFEASREGVDADLWAWVEAQPPVGAQ